MMLFVGTLIILAFEIDAYSNQIFSPVKNPSESNFYYTYSYTKAICDDNNYCRDYEIFCRNTEIVEMRFTGASVQFDKNWEDPREEVKNNFC